MKLLIRKKNGDEYETELPKDTGKRRVPQRGSRVTHTYNGVSISGTVTDIHYEYKQLVAVRKVQQTQITITVEED